MIGDLDSLPEADKLRMAAMIDQLQVRDRLFHLFPFFFLDLNVYRFHFGHGR